MVLEHSLFRARDFWLPVAGLMPYTLFNRCLAFYWSHKQIQPRIVIVQWKKKHFHSCFLQSELYFITTLVWCMLSFVTIWKIHFVCFCYNNWYSDFVILQRLYTATYKWGSHTGTHGGSVSSSKTLGHVDRKSWLCGPGSTVLITDLQSPQFQYITV